MVSVYGVGEGGWES